MALRILAVAAVVAFAVSATHAQDGRNSFDASVAVPKAWAILASAVESGNLSERSTAMLALSAAPAPRAMEMLQQIAADRAHPGRAAAIEVLPVEDTSDVGVIADALQDPILETRRAAIRRLGWMRDDRALPLLQSVILSDDPNTLEWAINSARLLGSRAFRMLLSSVEKGSPRTREAVLRCIEILLSGSTLSAAVNLEELQRLGPERVLEAALNDSSDTVRIFAALILARLGNDAGADELMRAAAASEPKLGTKVSRHVAVAALHTLGKPGYLPRLMAALDSAEERVRFDAAFAMQSFPRPSMRGACRALWSGSSDVRYQALECLLMSGSSGDVALLREALADRHPHIRVRAGEAFLKLQRDPVAVETLEALTADYRTRRRALVALTAGGDPRRTGALARSLLPEAAREGSRAQDFFLLGVIHTLEVVQDREAVPALSGLFGSEQNVNFRVARALVAIGQDDVEARRALVRALDSPHATARIHAAGGVISIFTR